MNRKCKCGSHLAPSVNMNEFAECMDCHKVYMLKDGEYKQVSKMQFHIEFRKKLIEIQKSNKY